LATSLIPSSLFFRKLWQQHPAAGTEAGLPGVLDDRHSRRAGLWRAAAGLLLLTVLVAASGCGRSGYDYVENRQEGLFLKVRDDWQIEELTSYQLDKIGVGCCWGRRLTAPERTTSPVPSTDPNIEDEPTGLVQIIDVEPEDHDNVNLSFLRSLMLGVDPAELAGMSADERAMTGQPEVDILDYSETNSGRAYGNDLLFRVQGDNLTWRTVRQLAQVNEDFTQIYLLVMSCSYECYASNSDEIDAIFDSWTLEKTGGS
jgi:hypothetical protein